MYNGSKRTTRNWSEAEAAFGTYCSSISLHNYSVSYVFFLRNNSQSLSLLVVQKIWFADSFGSSKSSGSYLGKACES